MAFAHRRPVVSVEVEGRPVRALIDTGAFHTTITRATALRLGLRLDAVTSALRVYGVGGAAELQAATATVKLAGSEWRNVRLPVIGERDYDGDIGLLIGQDFLSHADIEYDFAHGVLRLLRADHCADSDMPYWTTRYDEAPLLSDADEGAAVVPVKLNGRSVRAELDTGAYVSVATPATAAAAGVALKPLQWAGAVGGIGAARVPVQRAELSTFQIGGEVIPNVTLDFGNIFGSASYSETGSLLGTRVDAYVGMLLGADFFASHRVLISPSHHMVFFTYNGGPVFPAPAPQATARG